MPRLIILPKGQGIRQINVKGALTTIGRKEGNSLVLDSDRVSRTHAVIDWDGDHYTVIDTGSRNGTFVNGKQVRRQALRNGDMITIGDCEIRFLYETQALPEDQALRLVTIPGALADLDAMVAAARKRAKDQEAAARA
ncbi:FHA domain-containing protein [Variovorax sp. OV329]|uniref:FHA domain-containing protein n=1 Tax=Variovorax sp. OV329 TaxID=1882825 RepID=UPI0008E64E1A|nr:FHA domain-containing protein [Variovorax sp. OV329]SFM67083.1 FHA domain-containing protein [Variovorax sp. OV329]